MVNHDSRPIVVVAMRADEMLVAHPNTDYTHSCPECGEKIGIYPSTVKLMREKPNVSLICNRCKSDTMLHPLVPGAEAEVLRSRVRRP